MPSADITALLAAEREGGDEVGLDELFAAAYGELHRLAGAQRRRRRGACTLDTTALVHEAYLKLALHERVRWKDGGHFFALSAKAMRQILSNDARKERAAKRGGDLQEILLDDLAADAMPALPEENLDESISISDALKKLGRTSERQGRIVECRFLEDLSVKETAEALGISSATVKRDWRLARVRLRQEMAPR